MGLTLKNFEIIIAFAREIALKAVGKLMLT